MQVVGTGKVVEFLDCEFVEAALDGEVVWVAERGEVGEGVGGGG